jgi:hypothetical protein
MLASNNLLKKVSSTVLSLCLLICSLFISWVLLAQINFAYPALHSLMSIDKHIDKYGPQNRYKDDFELTDKPEQTRLFSEIVDAIHNNGTGLDSITYHTPKGDPINLLLRPAEVIHLEDVAHLINHFYLVSIITLIITCCLIAGFKYKKIKLPTLKQQALGILIFSAISFTTILIIGPVKVFYALHVWIFPDNHQWFFYYQESLMTVLMKAPDLFGAISGIIAVLGIIIYLALNRFILVIPSKK